MKKYNNCIENGVTFNQEPTFLVPEIYSKKREYRLNDEKRQQIPLGD